MRNDKRFYFRGGRFALLVALFALASNPSLFGQTAQIEDVSVGTELDPVYRNAVLKAEVKVRADSATVPGEYSVEGTLFDASGKEIPLEAFRATVRLAGDSSVSSTLNSTVPNPRKWTAETPCLYTLILRLKSDSRVLQEVSTPVGFRKVEVKGMRLLVNGVPIEIRGIVRDGSSAGAANHTLKSELESEIKLLKESNVNAVRSRSVPLEEDFLRRCDQRGIYVVADLPSDEASPALYARYKNHPSALLWHAGVASVARWLAHNDSTRPVMLCGSPANASELGTTLSDFHEDFMSHPEFREINSTPVIVSEFHTTPKGTDWLRDAGRVEAWGNALQQDWTAIRDRYFYVVGGLICCWDDSALSGDGTFKQLLPRIQKAYAPIQVTLQDIRALSDHPGATLKVTNRYSFTNLDGYAFIWGLSKAGQVLSKGQESYVVAPNTSFQFPLAFHRPPGADRLRVTVLDTEGHTVVDENFPLDTPQADADGRNRNDSGIRGTRPGSSRESSAMLGSDNLHVTLDPTSGLPAQLETPGKLYWLRGPVQLSVQNEVTRTTARLSDVHLAKANEKVSVSAQLATLRLNVACQLASTPSGLAWDLNFEGDGPRVGHEITIDLPILSADSQIFTPSNRGVIDVAARPTYKPPEYAHFGMFDGTSYVLPLVSVFDPKSDSALTIALPPDSNIPHLQVEWRDAKILRLTLGHRGMGGGKPSPLRLLFYSHAADYRAAIKAYSDDFPKYFHPTMPRNGPEGAFYYEHIEDHPPYEEMARQRVRYLWSSFWFTHVGEYLPPETEWIPYTFANWWRLGQKMSDEKIRSFIREMNDHGIRVFAFFNVDEYGGPGSYAGHNLHGDSPEIDEWRNARFRDALVKDADGKDIPSWEGCKVLNADKRYSFFPHLMEQVRRHLARLPEIEGFLIDRMDWASIIDYGHSDGLTMVGAKSAENMALPIAGAVQEVCRLNHEAGKRVYINQFYRVEMLRDVDGFCHENDYPPALGYLTPYRPVSAWHWRKPYHGDLMLFESQLKRRLQFAVFPQMIAHDFPICQQEPDARAADMLEIFAPLFSAFLGKEQVLLPHSVVVTGANDVNLFVNGDKNYVAPVTSRTRFLSRRVRSTEPATLTLRVPDAAEVKWAHVYRPEGPPYRASLAHAKDGVRVSLNQHGSVSVVVVGKGSEPPMDTADEPRLATLRERLFPEPTAQSETRKPSSAPSGAKDHRLVIEGTQVGDPGGVAVLVDGKRVGEITGARGAFSLTESSNTRPRRVTLVAPDEGVWFVPQRIELFPAGSDGKQSPMAAWSPEDNATAGNSTRELDLQLHWAK